MDPGSGQAPPFRLPGEHFAAALFFLVSGSVGLVLLAEELASGAYPSRHLVGVTHLFTLGWITTSILGALYQFMPVALGRPIRSVGLADASFGLHAGGLPLFVSGFLTGSRAVMLAGALALTCGLLLFLGNLGATLAAASRRDVTWWALSWAGVFLAVTLGLGMALALNLQSGFLGGNRAVTLGAHVHVALGGWVLLVIVGVANRLLPMFLLSHGVGEGPIRASVVLLASGAATLATFHHGPPVIGRWVPALLLAGGLSCFLVQAARHYRARVRRYLDPGMRLVAVSLGFLASGLILAFPVLLGWAGSRWVTAYVLVLVGGISLFVAAHYYKIIPFLVWYHRFGPLAGRRPVPRVADLFHAPTATVASVLLVLGVGGLALGVLLGEVPIIRAAGASLAAGSLLEGVQMLRISRHRPS